MIKIGSTIFIELNDPEEEKKRYRSKILDQEKDKIFVSFPVNEKTKKQAVFLEGTQFRSWFLGNDEAIYMFTTELLNKVQRGNIPMLVLKDPGKDNYVRIQRRQYVRIESAIDVAVYPVMGAFEPFTTVTADISAGGMALILPDHHRLKEGEEIQVWISLGYQSGEILYLNAKAKFIRSFKDKGITKGSFQFLNISEGERQKVIRFCFEKQLEQRKREGYARK